MEYISPSGGGVANFNIDDVTLDVTCPRSTPTPAINQVDFNGKKKLKITGANFGTAPRVMINGAEPTSFVSSTSDSSITLKGKARKLNLNVGDNLIQVIDSSGAPSNTFTLRL